MNEKVNNKVNFRCNICDKIYSSASSLCNHNKKFHNDQVDDRPGKVLPSSLKCPGNVLSDNENIYYKNHYKNFCEVHQEGGI